MCPLWEKQETDRYGHKAVVVTPEVGRRYKPGGLMVLLESPGFWETIGKQAGQPLAGKTGDLFTQLCDAAGVDRDTLIIDYMVRHRAPNNRVKDYPEAFVACGQWTSWMMQSFNPGVVVVMGAEPLKTVFGTEAGAGNTHGTLRSLPAKDEWKKRLVIASWHVGAAAFSGGLDSDAGRDIIRDLRTAAAVSKAIEGTVL